MFAKVYQYKFPGVSEAKVAASYCSDKLGKKIVEFDFEGLNDFGNLETRFFDFLDCIWTVLGIVGYIKTC